MLTWKLKYSLPTGGNYVVFVNSTGARGKVVINGVKSRVFNKAIYYILSIDIFEQQCVVIECMLQSSRLEDHMNIRTVICESLCIKY